MANFLRIPTLILTHYVFIRVECHVGKFANPRVMAVFTYSSQKIR
jgi:hypothetical protein